jgi:hypothetical protein
VLSSDGNVILAAGHVEAAISRISLTNRVSSCLDGPPLVLPALVKSDAKTHRTPKHCVRNPEEMLCWFAKLSECARVLGAAFAA